jgi:branched-chain amino acid transport system ATP-binding protein
MCAIGRALMASPRLLIIDEVTLGLAPLVVEALFAALAELHRQGMTLLTVEQNVPLVLAHADRGCVLSGGAHRPGRVPPGCCSTIPIFHAISSDSEPTLP